jgi:hypothetical protein
MQKLDKNEKSVKTTIAFSNTKNTRNLQDLFANIGKNTENIKMRRNYFKTSLLCHGSLSMSEINTAGKESSC